MKSKFKRYLALVLSLVVVIGLMAAPASAATETRASSIQVYVNDTLVEFPDAKPFVDENSRTMIPVRFVTEAMDADVSWESSTKTAVIEKDGITVRIKFGDKNLVVIKNGVESIVEMDTEAVAKDGRTFVPIRFVAEALGAFVDYSNLYNIVEIVTPTDELTADDIERLRSYDLIQYYHTNRDGDEWFTSMTEYKYFKGSYWFSNSHNFLRQWDEPLGYEAKSTHTKYYCTENTSAYNFTIFCLDYVNDLTELELLSVNPETGRENYESWTYHEDNWLDVTYNFRSCTNLVYQQVCPPLALISVRGILDITCGEDTPKQWITDNYGIENPEYGKTYSIDVEFIVGVNGRHYITNVVQYYFDADGVAHEMDTHEIANYHK